MGYGSTGFDVQRPAEAVARFVVVRADQLLPPLGLFEALCYLPENGHPQWAE